MKHAYLIMAHNQFLSLQELVSALDDARNDIYIHFDNKVKIIPEIHTRFSNLIILDKRVSVIWGDVSQIKAEYALFKASFQYGKYDYYHLISGNHFPLKSNDDLNKWFEERKGFSILKIAPLNEEEILMRIGRYHFFLKHLVSHNKKVNKAYHLGWRIVLSLQKLLGIKRDTSFIKGKASQWCSLSEEAIVLLLSKEKESLKRFRRSFCCDEYFIRSVIEGIGLPIIYDDSICYVSFVRTTPRYFTENDYQILMDSGALFFRKMRDSNLGLAKLIEQTIQHQGNDDKDIHNQS